MTDYQDSRWKSIAEARWFSGKNRGGRLHSTTPLDWYTPPKDDAPGVRSEISTIVYPDGEVEYYQLLISYRPKPLPEGYLEETPWGYTHLATKDPEALTAYVNALLNSGVSRQNNWWATTVRADLLKGDLSPQVLSGEQSNTCIALGRMAIIKLLRRLEAGTSPDIVLLDALSRVGVRQVIELFGWVSARLSFHAGEPQRTDLAMIAEYVNNATDGWEFVKTAAISGEDIREEIHALGRALVRIHRGLAEAFPSARVSGADLAQVMTARLDRAAVEVAGLNDLAVSLRRIFTQLNERKIRVQRIHGDFHLGQTLINDEGWHILDFEGEPLKTLSEREQPDSVWRDVAGLVRSLSYASAHGRKDDSWLADHVTAFICGYSGIPLDEANAYIFPETDQLVLDVYIADKAIYEALYEIRNRPDWVDIPMAALSSIIARHH